ncbi:hypothetical protein [Xanthomonas euvesicatoria]|uniref:CdiA C-terminal domain-containing protein n=1 Tax=Xanthomonas euvesicatoria TaxID=456327 RepID=UPI00210DC23F|nr:hypothetical protein [Xanthomonas euvesicatoria]
MINGELADVYSPRANSPISVIKTLANKVEDQASIIVVNLADSPLTLDQVGNALKANPVKGLNKIYI